MAGIQSFSRSISNLIIESQSKQFMSSLKDFKLLKNLKLEKIEKRRTHQSNSSLKVFKLISDISQEKNC